MKPIPFRAAKRTTRSRKRSLLQVELLEQRLIPAVLLPGPLLAAHPSDNPGLPAQMDVFTPPVSGQAVLQAPAFGEWTRTGGPDDTLALTGAQFSSFSGLDSGKDSQFVAWGQTTPSNGSLATSSIQRLDGSVAAVTLDRNLTANSMYLVWAENNAGASTPIAVNKTETWWVGPDNPNPGQTLSIYGRNLAHDSTATATSWVYLKPASGAGQWLQVTAANPYKVDVVLPSNVALGQYQVWVHNGHGGQYGWSDPVTIDVRAPYTRTNQVFSVKDYGAKGNGLADDTSAIKAAIAAADQQPGSRVYFPTGVYMVSQDFNTPSRMEWFGDGKDKTFIQLAANFTSTGSFMNGGGTDFTLRDLTVDANGHLELAASKTLFNIRGSQDVRFEGTRIVANSPVKAYPGYATMDLANTVGVTLKNNDFIQSNTTFLGNAGQLFVDGNTFYGVDDAEGFLFLWGGQQGVSITNNVARDFDNTQKDGWAEGRFFVVQNHWGNVSNVFLGGNRTIALGMSYVNSGEQILFESQRPSFQALVEAATATTIRLPGLDSTHVDDRIVIADGKGLGQERRVVATDLATGTITVDRPWNVIPDSTSRAFLTVEVERVAVYDNDLAGKPGTVDSASIGVNFYGETNNIVVDRNRITDTQSGLSLWINAGSDANEIIPNTCYFPTIVNNTFTNTSGISLIGHDWSNGARSYPKATYLLGSVIRGNTFNNLQGSALSGQSDFSGPSFALNVFEHNQGSNLPGVIDLAPQSSNILDLVAYDNHFDRGSAPLTGSNAVNVGSGIGLPAFHGNLFTNFDTNYSGTLPGGVLEIPQRVLEGNVAAGGTVSVPLTLWNSGTAPLSWTLSEGLSWLTPSATSGTVADQNFSGTVNLAINSAGLTSGQDISGDLTITGNGRTQKVHVFVHVSNAAYLGSPVIIAPTGTSVVYAVNYDKGGEGVGYHSADSQNQGGAYRNEGVDIRAGSNASNGYQVGWTNAGEWLGYTIQVPQSGSYDITVRLASGGGGGSLHLEFGPVGQVGGAGTSSTSTFTVGGTGSWDTFTNVTVHAVNLSSGTQWMRLIEDTGGYDIDTITFAPASSQAIFVTTNTAAHGAWKGTYGSDGWSVEGDPSSNAVNIPSYASVNISGNWTYTWSGSTTDARALQEVSAGSRLAACWYSGSSFTIDVNLTDGKPHQVALYALDWDNYGPRNERIDVIDANTGVTLNSRTVSSFQNGKYLVWDIQGHVKFVVTNLAGASSNAVISGIFFDPDPPAASFKAGAAPKTGSKTAYSFTVNYKDLAGIDTSSLGNNNMKITGPGGYSILATFTSYLTNPDGSVTATYTAAAPSAGWQNVRYTVSLQAKQVKDKNGFFAMAATIGSFTG